MFKFGASTELKIAFCRKRKKEIVESKICDKRMASKYILLVYKRKLILFFVFCKTFYYIIFFNKSISLSVVVV